MTNKLIIVILAALSLSSCSKTITEYVPVEKVKTEYRDVIKRDSIYERDSIFIKAQNDTVWIEKWKTKFSYKYKTDSIYKVDSIQVPYPVEKIVKEKYVSGWQNFQIWLGRIFGVLILLMFGYKLLKLKNII